MPSHVQDGEEMMDLRNRSTEIGGALDLLATAAPTAQLIPLLVRQQCP